MIHLTRRFRFSASHRLHAPALSDGRNREVYGKCNNPRGHGHDYVLEVSVRGGLDPRTGCVVSVPALDAMVRSRVLDILDHRSLNLAMREVPTTENLVLETVRRLSEAWPVDWPALDRVRIRETRRNSFEYMTGPIR